MGPSMASRETPIVRRGHGPRAKRHHPIADRANGFAIGEIIRVEVPTSGRPMVMWWAVADDGLVLGSHRRRCDAVAAVFGHYRMWDTVRYACGRMAA